MEPIGRRRWAIAEGDILSSSTGPEPHMTSHETVCLLNTGGRDADVRITIFYSDREPVGPYRVNVPAQRTKHVPSPRDPPVRVRTGVRKEMIMPKKTVRSKGRKARRKGPSPSTQAGKFVREEMRQRRRRRRTRSRKQAVAIGLSTARRAGIRVPPNKQTTGFRRTRKRSRSAKRR